MSFYPPSLVNLIKQLSKLPGIGEKTAERLALHILRGSVKDAQALAESISEAKETVRLCSVCYGLADSDPCHICRDATRDQDVVCVVEQGTDMVALEKSGAFKGRYHVLQGCLSPMNGVGPDNLRIRELVERLKKEKIKEVVVATGTSVEGESTANYLRQVLEGSGVKITRIASGVPIGGDLKYTDALTLKRALDSRHCL
ncbi:recombination mediator RecR [Desulfatibacillum aliphaticivorans]|uniref:Recombination protein RecR n=1 Tax=Desulfatibacillum aliphaticivorans TaxID=218208 RepID=RECR_DESAL|nr:recombination mediator RecR [Desulfatibacillum aliphaticivorans]B8FG16.1 RecName: Full=Recombination protein RecR [Desulfatibacillum aliphaticivorans]ACL03696.1 recombination protein RecR [Desulfatibacillum aliphaticivorans]